MLACIALGSNLNAPLHHIKQGLHALNTLPHTRLRAHSRYYKSKAITWPTHSTRDTSPSSAPDFINAVAIIDTALPPLELLSSLHSIEAAQGRNRAQSTRWGPRTLDLDIILYGTLTLTTPTLTLPHPYAHQRWFVAGPALEAMLYLYQFSCYMRCFHLTAPMVG